MRTLLALLVIAQAYSAYAQQQWYWYSGNELKAKCESDVARDQAMCGGFILGIVDQTNALHKVGHTQVQICPPNDATREQLQAVVEKYLQENPADLHYAAAPQVTMALREAFPCR